MRQQGFTASRGADEQDIALVDLDIAIALRLQALVMVVNSYREDLFGRILFDNIFIQHGLYLFRDQKILRTADVFFRLLFNDLTAELNAFIADIYGRTGYQLGDLFLVFSTEGALR